MNEVSKIINSSTIDAALKAKLVHLVQIASAAMIENDQATSMMYRGKNSLNERQYASRLSTSVFDQQRDELVLQQIACRNEYANSVYRAQGARRALQEVGKEMHALISDLFSSAGDDQSALVVVVSVRELIERCVLAGADVPNAVVRELEAVAGITKDKLEEAVRELFQQHKTGVGKFARLNFSSQPIMVTAKDSDEQRALWEASQKAIELFYRVREVASNFNSAKSKLNVRQFVDRLERAQLAGDQDKFRQIQREQRSAEANLWASGSVFLLQILGYQTQIDAFAAVITAAADVIPEVKGNAHLMAASNCLGAWHWLHEMQRQLDIAWKHHDPRDLLAQLKFNVEQHLHSQGDEPWKFGTELTSPESSRSGTPLC